SQKTAQCQRVRRPPCDATLAVDAFKIPDEQQTEVPPRRQTRPPHPLRVEPGALLFHPFVKAALFQQSVQLFRKTDALPSAASLSVRSKSPLVVAASLFGPLPCAQSTAHCCGSLNYLRRESRLAPRAARAGIAELEVCISSYCDLARFGGLALTPHGHAVMPVGNIAHGVITGRRGVRVIRCGHHDDISNHLRMHIAQQRNDTGPIEAELAIVAGRPSAQVACQALVARNRWPAHVV